MGSRANARIVVLGIALLAALAALAITSRPPGSDVAHAGTVGTPGGLQATIRWTTHGIPHIVASDFPGLGFGYGYAAAKENICVLADTYATVNAERSRWFGPDASYSQGGNGTTNNNLNSDFFFQKIKENGSIERLLALDPPRGPRPEIKLAVRGYVAGYNKWLRETGAENITDPRCQGAGWVRPITEMDAYRRFYQLGLIASQGVAIDGIGGAQPPVGAGPTPPTPAEVQQMIGQLGEQLPLGGIGSNAYGLGRDATDNGRGMVLGNPHFPWDGSERFFEAHLTIPGQINVSGASLFGVPVINIGHTDHLAWSHTVSTAYRFTPFELRLVPGSPTSYIYDGEVRQMTAQDVTVQVKNPDGSIEDRSRTLYDSHHGSILTGLLGLPLFPWTPTTAWAIGDANAGNFRYLNHFFEVNQAQDVDELDELIKRNQGVPWVNTIAADSDGDAYYADISVVPHVTNEKATTCNTVLGRATFEALGLPVLDGSLSTCEWGSDPDAVEPGIFGPSNLPSMRRDDYVLNSNDSYWLTNPDDPIEGYDRIIGDERTERALRTRSGLVMAAERLAGADGRPGDRFTRQQLQDIVFDNRQYAGELWRDELASFCETTPVMTGSSGPVDVSEACPVLRAWDVHDDLDSRGAILFRRFASRALGAVPVAGTPGLYTTQFDFADPVYTPRGLNIANPAVEQSFADAVSDLRNAGIPLDAPLRDWQYERRGSEKVPIHGGPGTVGVFNAINVGWTGSGANAGYSNVPHGSSFVMVAQFTGDEDCPVDTRSILTYSQSTQPQLALLRRPDAHVLQQAVGRRGLLRERDRGRPEPRDHRDLGGNRLPAAQGRHADPGPARAGLPAVHVSRPHARAAARVPVVQLARADVGQPHGRHSRPAERRGRKLHRIRAVRRAGRRTGTARRFGHQDHGRAHRRAVRGSRFGLRAGQRAGRQRLHRRLAGERAGRGSRTNGTGPRRAGEQTPPRWSTFPSPWGRAAPPPAARPSAALAALRRRRSP